MTSANPRIHKAERALNARNLRRYRLKFVFPSWYIGGCKSAPKEEKNMHRSSCLLLVVGTTGAILLAANHARAGCPCQADVNNSGGLNVIDVAIIVDCANQVGCAQCVNSCDVNCDGNVDFVDVGAAWCAFQLNPNCCSLTDGACTHSQTHSPSCLVTDQDACTDAPGFFEGTYHGDNTACEGNQVIDRPAASEWGLLALGLLMLIGGCLIMRSRTGCAVSPT
jgi:hypothetical protein